MAADENGSNQEGPSPEELYNQMMAETEGLIPKGFAREVERDLAGEGKFAILRRHALTYLERPFRETTEQMRTNREFAVAAAHISEVLRGAIESHEALVGWLQAAHTRLWIAVAAARGEDFEAVFAEAKADAERVKHDDLHNARFIKQLKASREVKP